MMTQDHHTHSHADAALCCGHCGTPARSGYTVCAACGANYRRRGSGFFIGAIFGLASANAFSAGEWGVGLILALILVALVRRSRQFNWYRRHA